MRGEQVPLLLRTSTIENARLRNRNKRVKLYSKRLRHIWPRIAAFSTPQDIVGLSCTCRRLQRLVDNDRVWQIQYDRILNQRVIRSLLPRLEMRFGNNLLLKEKFRRVMHARRLYKSTNPLQLRLREAERDKFRQELRQRKVRVFVWMNVPLVLALCCLSVWSYTTTAAESMYHVKPPAARLRGIRNGSFSSASLPTFVLVTDLLLLLAVMVLKVGYLDAKALYTAGLLVVIETAVMLVEFAAWSSSLQIAHSFLMLTILTFNIVLGAKETKRFERELAAFLPSY